MALFPLCSHRRAPSATAIFKDQAPTCCHFVERVRADGAERAWLTNGFWENVSTMVRSFAIIIARSIPNTDPHPMNLAINPLIALGVLASTAATDAAYVFFNAAVSSRRRFWAANWSSIWYMLSAFAVISYTENWVYVAFAALGSWIGAFVSVTWLHRGGSLEPQRHDPP
jgi:hypothetical protein